MRRPRACSGGQPKARGRRKRGQERGRPQRRARRGRGGPTHTTQTTRDGNREQPREPRREDGEEADETEMSAAPDARPMSEITIARHMPMEPSSQRQGLVKGPVPTGQGLIPGSEGSRRLPVSLGSPHGGPCEEVQSAGTEFEPGTSAGRSRNPEELNRPSEPDFHNLRGVPNVQDPTKQEHANHPGRKPASRKIPRREPRVSRWCAMQSCSSSGWPCGRRVRDCT